jgi:pyrrolidone-carboxylate peptidase
VLLAAGFEPYASRSVNPSAQVALMLPRQIRGINIKRVVLPCSSARTPGTLVRLARSPAIRAVLLIGEDARYETPTIELQATNKLDYFVCDNDGRQPRDCVAIQGGPPLLVTNVDVDRLAEFAERHRITMAMSRDAGGHLCNETYFALMYHAPSKLGLLLHVPRLPERQDSIQGALPESLRMAHLLVDYLLGAAQRDPQ